MEFFAGMFLGWLVSNGGVSVKFSEPEQPQEQPQEQSIPQGGFARMMDSGFAWPTERGKRK